MQRPNQMEQNHQGQGHGDYLDPYLTEMLEVVHGQAARQWRPLQRHPWLPGMEVGATPESLALQPRNGSRPPSSLKQRCSSHSLSCPYQSHSDHGSRGSSAAAIAANMRACMGSQASKLNKVIAIIGLYFMSLV
jgi:hypothetical protein